MGKRSRSLSRSASKGMKKLSRSIRSLAGSSTSVSGEGDADRASKKKSKSASIDHEALKASRIILPCLTPVNPRNSIHFSTLEGKVRNAGGELVMYVGPPGTPTSVTVKQEDDDVFESPKSPSKVERQTPDRGIGSAIGTRGAPEGSEGLSVGGEVKSTSDDEFETLEKNEAIVDQLLKDKTPASKAVIDDLLKDKPMTHGATQTIMDELLKDKTEPKTESSDAFSALEKRRLESGKELQIQVNNASGKGEVKGKSPSRKEIVDEEIMQVSEEAEVYEENDSYLHSLDNKSNLPPSRIPRPITEPTSPPPNTNLPPSKIPLPVGKKAPSPSPVRKSSTDSLRRKSVDEKEPRRKSIDEKETRAKKLVDEEAQRMMVDAISLLEKDITLEDKKSLKKPKRQLIAEDEMIVGNAADVYEENPYADSLHSDSPRSSILGDSPRSSIVEHGKKEDSRYDNMLDNVSSIMKEMEEEKHLLSLLSNAQPVANDNRGLGVQAGPVIENILLENGWSEGDLDGKRGIFPTSCLSMVEELYKTKPKADDAIDRSEVEAAMKLDSLEPVKAVDAKKKKVVVEELESEVVVEEAFEEPDMDFALPKSGKSEPKLDQKPKSLVQETESVAVSEHRVESLLEDEAAKQHLEKMRRIQEALDECLQPDPIIELETRSEVEPKPEAKKVDPKPEAKKVEPKPEAKEPEPKAEAKKVESKPAAKKVEPKPEAKKVEPKAEAKKVEPKPKAKKVEPKAEAKKVEPKAEAKKVES